MHIRGNEEYLFRWKINQSCVLGEKLEELSQNADRKDKDINVLKEKCVRYVGQRNGDAT